MEMLLVGILIFCTSKHLPRATGLQTFTCSPGETFDASVTPNLLYASSLLQCSLLCHVAGYPTFVFNSSNQECALSVTSFVPVAADSGSTRCYIKLLTTTTLSTTTTSLPTTITTLSTTITALPTTDSLLLTTITPFPTTTTALTTTSSTIPATTSTTPSTPSATSTITILTTKLPTTTLTTPETTTALPGDNGAQCTLGQSFSLTVISTGAQFYCCHGWEYKDAINRDLTFYASITAANCRLNCDVDTSCFSFVYYGNASCQMSSCSNELSCTKADVTTTDAIWCYY